MLTDNEVERLRNAIIATVASPVIGSIEDYSWEAIFHYVKNIPLSDPAMGRSKLLYDAVDATTKTGWSLKSLQLPLNSLSSGNTFLFVIQRADIVKKSVELGFPNLTESSSPDELGAAIIKHWNEKIFGDKLKQKVEKSYEGILLKTKNGNEYIYCEYSLDLFDSTRFFWQWAVDKKSGERGLGLQGTISGAIELIWYKNQKQLFRARTIPSQAVRISIKRTRLTADRYVATILSALEEQMTITPPNNDS